MFKYLNIKLKNGFSLIELLTAVAIFSITVGIAMGAFTAGIRAQRKSLVEQQLFDQTSYAMEYMSRALRMAKKDISGACTGQAKSNYGVSPGQIAFVNYSDSCQKFYLSGDQLMEEKDGITLALTSPNFQVSEFNINLTGNDQTDSLQPRVTIFLALQGTGGKSEERPEIKIQTTISQRNPDIEE